MVSDRTGRRNDRSWANVFFGCCFVKAKERALRPALMFSNDKSHPLVYRYRDEWSSILIHMSNNAGIAMATHTWHHEWIGIVALITRRMASFTSGVPVNHLDILRERFIRPVARSAFTFDEIEIAAGIGTVNRMDPVGDGYGMVARLIMACQALISIKDHCMACIVKWSCSSAMAACAVTSGNLILNRGRADLYVGKGRRFNMVIAVADTAVISNSHAHHIGTGFHAGRNRQQLVAETGLVSGNLWIGAVYKQQVFLGRRFHCTIKVRIGNCTCCQYRYRLGSWSIYIQTGDT